MRLLATVCLKFTFKEFITLKYPKIQNCQMYFITPIPNLELPIKTFTCRHPGDFLFSQSQRLLCVLPSSRVDDCIKHDFLNSVDVISEGIRR